MKNFIKFLFECIVEIIRSENKRVRIAATIITIEVDI